MEEDDMDMLIQTHNDASQELPPSNPDIPNGMINKEFSFNPFPFQQMKHMNPIIP